MSRIRYIFTYLCLRNVRSRPENRMIMMEEMIITYYCIATLIVIAYLLG